MIKNTGLIDTPRTSVLRKITDSGSPVIILDGGLSLRINFVWTLVGNVIYSGCQWAMLVVLAKLGTPEMVGEYALGLAVTAPIITLANLQLRGVQVTDAKHRYHFGDYLGLRIITTVLALITIVLTTIAIGYSWDTTLVIITIGLAKAFESVSDVIFGLLQQHEQMDRIAKSMIIKGMLSLAALGLGIYWTHNVFWATVGLALTWFLVLLFYDLRSAIIILKSNLHPNWNASVIIKLASIAFPLGIVVSLNSLTSNIPRFFAEGTWGVKELGIFAALAYLLLVGNTVVNALGQAASPRLAKYHAKEEHRAFLVLLGKLIAIGFLLGIAGILVSIIAGQEILQLIYGSDYARRADVLSWIMLSGLFTYIGSFLGYGVTAARRFKEQVPLSALVALTTALACIWFGVANGLSGIAIALVIAAVVQVGGNFLILLFSLRISNHPGVAG